MTPPQGQGAPWRLVGDVACPWTYLAFTALCRAVGDDVRLDWHPYLLRPETKRQDTARIARAAVDYAAWLQAPISPAALGQPVAGRTAHGALLAASAEGAAALAARALFEAHFARGDSLARDIAIERALAVRVGTERAVRWLGAARTNGHLVDRATRAARLAGVNEIPLLIADGRFVISGLQPPEAYAALDELTAIQLRLQH